MDKTRASKVDGREEGEGEEEEWAQTLWRMLHVGGAGFLSRSPGGLQKMVTAIVTACVEFRHTGSEAPRRKLCACGRNARGERCRSLPLLQFARNTNKKQTIGLTYLGGASSADNSDLSGEIVRRLQRAWPVHAFGGIARNCMTARAFACG